MGSYPLAMDHNFYASQLNERQLEVVTDTENPVLVLAGAGSGKTRSLIYRTAYLIKEQNVHPWNILIVTFTNKAARELQERLEKLLNIPVRSLWVGTFHSICCRILRYESANLPFNANFSIYDDDTQKSLLKKIYKEYGIDKQNFPVNHILNRISRYKNKLMLPEDIQMQEEDKDSEFAVFLNIYRLYQQQLLLNQALDFDDILLWTAKLLMTNNTVREKYRAQFQYVMIDEYQDTNTAQFEIVHQIAAGHQRVCVVGDDDQAIYSFRGASLRNILEFEKDYNCVHSIRLEQNYRSTGNILALANAIIANNRRRHRKELWSELPLGDKPILAVYENEIEEANRITEAIIKLQEKGIPLRNIAVLYRTNAQSRVFESALIQAEIPYSIVGGVQFYQRKEIKDLLAYLYVLSNLNDNESLLRIINEPARGIGQTSINRLIGFANKTRISLFRAIQNVDAIEDMGNPAKKRIGEFCLLMERWQQSVSQKPALELVKTIVEELGLISHYQNSNDPQDIARAENLVEFVTSVSEFSEHFYQEYEREPVIADYLPYVALQTDLDRVKEGVDSIRLMTLHNAKGLEFEAVLIAGLEDELLPHRLSMNNQDSIEEERRLFYVGITRAKNYLHLSYTKSRRLYDTFYFPVPSQFLAEVDSGLFCYSEGDFGIAQPPKRMKKPIKVITESQKHYRIGQKIFHPEYGRGIILNVDGEGADARLTISFGNKLVKIIGSYVKSEEG
ncbi:MAG TPA: UvrD-helicase domain-containing protein [Candidatus Cloacimonas sp.]|nr:UvrD-helicase domain-containing protein [Candidatus Cloacimonas sp.]